MSATGCAASVNCKDYAAFGLVVDVLDASQARTCNASVTATDGPYSEVLAAVPGPPCAYHGAAERKGVYSIKVEAAGMTTVVDGLKVSADACHVGPLRTTITLGT